MDVWPSTGQKERRDFGRGNNLTTDQNATGKVHIQPEFGNVGAIWLWSMVPASLLERIDDFDLE
jgi:hypothetical protein